MCKNAIAAPYAIVNSFIWASKDRSHGNMNN